MNYRIQEMEFNGKRTHRILQNVGGPCPLIGLCNALLLQNDIRVNQKVKSIKFSDLTFCLRDHLHKLFEVNMSSNKNVEQTAMANAIQNIEDCVELFPKLEEGLDINIQFNDSTAFEFTPAVAMFDNYNIRILHGWVIDPQNTQLHTILKTKSYNQIVDFLTSENDENAIEKENEKLLIRDFLKQFSQQLTAHGLFRMHEVMNENEIAIFFRNNHFSTVYKHKGHIYELVTDEGIVDADPRIIWQSLSQLSGDEEFLSKKFTKIQANYSQEKRLKQFEQIKKINENVAVANEQKNNENNSNNNDANAANNVNNNANAASLTYEQQEKYLNEQFANTSAENLAAAQNIAVAQEFGISTEELNQMKKEQQNALNQIENNKNNNNNNNSNNNYANSNAYEQARIRNQQNRKNYAYARNYNNNVNNNQNSSRNRNRRRKQSKSDDCVVL